MRKAKTVFSFTLALKEPKGVLLCMFHKTTSKRRIRREVGRVKTVKRKLDREAFEMRDIEMSLAADYAENLDLQTIPIHASGLALLKSLPEDSFFGVQVEHP